MTLLTLLYDLLTKYLLLDFIVTYLHSVKISGYFYLFAYYCLLDERGLVYEYKCRYPSP